MCECATQPLMRNKSGKKPTLQITVVVLLTEPGLSGELCASAGQGVVTVTGSSWGFGSQRQQKDFFAG